VRAYASEAAFWWLMLVASAGMIFAGVLVRLRVNCSKNSARQENICSGIRLNARESTFDDDLSWLAYDG